MKNGKCPMLDLKRKRDYRVVVASMTISKLLRIHCPGKVIILIPVTRLHSIKGSVSKACNEWYNETLCLNKRFS